MSNIQDPFFFFEGETQGLPFNLSMPSILTNSLSTTTNDKLQTERLKIAL